MTLREFIQSKLDEIDDIEMGTEVPDDMLVENVVYFSYLINENITNKDFEQNGTYNVSLNGYIKLKTSIEIDSLSLIDQARKKIQNKLKEINFSVSFNDVSIIDTIRKIQVRANATYNEINNGLI